MSKAAQVYGLARLRGKRARLLARAAPPAWAFVNVPMLDISSTRLRARGAWTQSEKA